MTAISGSIGCVIVGSERAGQSIYQPNNEYNVLDLSYAWTYYRFRDHDYYNDFNLNFFPLSSSGSPIYALVGGGSGNLMPDQSYFRWGNYYRDPLISRIQNYVAPYNGYRNYIISPSRSGYLDLGPTFDLGDHFTLYFNTTANNGVLFSRGTSDTNGMEFEIYLSQIDNNTTALYILYYDIYGASNILYRNLHTNADQTNHFVVYYSGSPTRAMWGTANIDELDIKYITNVNGITNWQYNVPPRRMVVGAESRLFKTINDSYGWNLNLDGAICEFGSMDSEWVYDERRAYIDKCGANAYNTLHKSGVWTDDTTWMGQSFVACSSAVTDTIAFQLEPHASGLYQFLGTFDTAPSSMRSVMCIEHNTNHSGVMITPVIQFMGGYSEYRTWIGEAFVPSGAKQEITIYPTNDTRYYTYTSNDTFNEYPTLDSNFTSIQVWFHVDYDNNDGKPYDADLKLYSFRFEADGWAVVPTGDSSITLFQRGGPPIASNSTDLFLFNQQGTVASGVNLYIDNKQSNNYVDLFVKAHEIYNNAIPLHTINIETKASGIPLITNGKVYSYANMPLYTEGPDVFNVGGSGSLNLFTYSTAQSSIRNTVSLHTVNEGYANPLYSLPLVVQGPANLPYSASMPLYIAYNGYSASNGINLSVLGPSGYNSNIPLYINAPGSNSGYYPANAGMNLFIARDYQTVDRNMTLYLQTKEPMNSQVTLYTNASAAFGSGVMSLYTSGIGRPSQSVNLFSHGF